jgi:hypothetical protein
MADEFGLIPLEALGLNGVDSLVNCCCQSYVFTPSPKAAVLEMIIDVSSSMTARAANAPAGAPNPWTLTKEALSAAIDRLPPEVAVGLAFYPNMATPSPPTEAGLPTDCINPVGDVPVAWLGASGSLERQAIAQALEAIQIPESGWDTPTYDAYAWGLRGLLEQRSVLAASDRRYLLLVTDGLPTLSQNCLGVGGEESLVEATPILEAIGAAKAQGIRTFVVGAPGSNLNLGGTDPRVWLSAAAVAGGTAILPDCSDQGPSYCHVDLSTDPDLGQELQAALTVLDQGALPCKYSLPSPTPADIDPNQVGIAYTERPGEPSQKEYLMVPSHDSECGMAWRYTNGARSEIEICGAMCERIQQNPDARLDLLFDCNFVHTSP